MSNSSALERAQPPVATSPPENGDGDNSTSASGVTTTAGSSPVGKHKRMSLELKALESDLSSRSVVFLLFV